MTVAADTGIILISGASGAWVGYIAGAIFGTATSGAALGATFFGAASVVQYSVMFDALNPIAQYKQIEVLAPEIIYDQEVVADDVEEFAKILDLVLKKT